MTKVMTPQGIERETDDLFYWEPTDRTEEQEFQLLWDSRTRPEEFADKKGGARYAAWLKHKGYDLDKEEDEE